MIKNNFHDYTVVPIYPLSALYVEHNPLYLIRNFPIEDSFSYALDIKIAKFQQKISFDTSCGMSQTLANTYVKDILGRLYFSGVIHDKSTSLLLKKVSYSLLT